MPSTLPFFDAAINGVTSLITAREQALKNAIAVSDYTAAEKNQTEIAVLQEVLDSLKNLPH